MELTIYADMLDEVTKKLNKLARKAERYNVPFSYTIGEEHPQKVSIHEYDEITNSTHVKDSYMVSAVDVVVDCDGFIRSSDWAVVAKLEHTDKGNIVTPFGGAAVSNDWYSLLPRCEHCNSNRERKTTFIVKHSSGSIKQVGKTCLKDYTGIDPALAALWACVRDIFPESFDLDDFGWEGHRRIRVFDTTDVLAHACDLIKANGYRKANSYRSTKEEVFDRLINDLIPTAEGMEQAKKVNEWLKTRDAPDVGDLERNCSVLAKSGYAKIRHIGILSYAPVAYQKYLERIARQASRESKMKEEMKSEYVGSVGERITFKADTAKLLTSWETDYGMKYLYKFTSGGNVLMWFATTSKNVEGKTTITGTVKEHNIRDGVKQTIITRCKVS